MNAIAFGDKLDFLLRTGNGEPGRQAKTQANTEDDLDMFFRSVACTMRKFPAVDIALVKKKIIDAVNEKEIFLSNQDSSTIHLVYVPNGNGEFFTETATMDGRDYFNKTKASSKGKQYGASYHFLVTFKFCYQLLICEIVKLISKKYLLVKIYASFFLDMKNQN